MAVIMYNTSGAKHGKSKWACVIFPRDVQQMISHDELASSRSSLFVSFSSSVFEVGTGRLNEQSFPFFILTFHSYVGEKRARPSLLPVVKSQSPLLT